jgi:hypothetical protein
MSPACPWVHLVSFRRSRAADSASNTTIEVPLSCGRDPVASDEPWRARDSRHEFAQLSLGGWLVVDSDPNDYCVHGFAFLAGDVRASTWSRRVRVNGGPRRAACRCEAASISRACRQGQGRARDAYSTGRPNRTL